MLSIGSAIAARGQGFNTVINFNASDGGLPIGPLAQGRDGRLYGTTSGYGANNEGTVFKANSRGVVNTLYNFCTQTDCPDGYSPQALVLATDGSFYGVTTDGGASFACDVGCGTVFKISATGKFTTLYSFCSQPNCLDGASPYGGLVQGIDGNFYGTTQYGGDRTCNNSISTCGTLFRITPRGILTTLYVFHGPDGAFPQVGLVQARDGNLYGTTNGGGFSVCALGCGTVFKITPAGILTTLHRFALTDGANPISGLVQSTGGNLFGTTYSGGDLSCDPDFGCGTVFGITPSGTLMTVHNFTGLDGSGPTNGPIQATNGLLYGTTISGGSISCYRGCGTVFSLDMGLAPFVAFVQAAGKVGETAQILGQGFEGTTEVSFNGTPANFNVASGTYLTATVPDGATTGYVTVTTPTAVLKSNVPFRVIN